MIAEKRKNLSKAIYDLGKLTFGGLVIGYFVNPQLGILKLVLGITFTILLFITAYFADNKEVK